LSYYYFFLVIIYSYFVCVENFKEEGLAPCAPLATALAQKRSQLLEVGEEAKN